MNEAVIRAEKLGKTCRGQPHTPVFDGLDFRSRLMKPSPSSASGAGKSTLLHLLGGPIRRPGRGLRRRAEDERVVERRTRLRNQALGSSTSVPPPAPEFTALENVMLLVLLGGATSTRRIRRAKALLESVGLGHRLAHKPGELSGGERQRRGGARALNAGLRAGDEPLATRREDRGQYLR